MRPLVSILIPAFNAERWIAQTLESALAQAWSSKEIIVVDDGSTDSTLAIAKSFKRPNLEVVTQPNAGAAAARNRALTLAQGSYIQWLDADDLLDPHKIAIQMRLAEEVSDSRVLFSGPWAYFMYRSTAAKFAPTPLWENLQPVEWVVRKWTHNVHMQTATWLVSRELSAAAGPWNPDLVVDDDGEYFTRVVLASCGVRFAQGARVFYRIVGTNRVSRIGTSTSKLESQLRSMELQIACLLRHRDDPEVRAAVVTYLQSWLPLFHPERPDLVNRMDELASGLGAVLQRPRIGAKYWLVDTLFGRVAAKQARLRYNSAKTSVLRLVDGMLYSLLGE